MSKMVKELMTQELRERYADVNSALWIELVGADGNTTNEFRRDLRGKELRVEIVKTALFRRAMAERPLEPLAKAMEGPAALVTGGESAIDAAKVLEEWARKIEGLKMRGAVLEGEFLEESRMPGLSKMPTKRDLQAKILGIALAPGANLLGAALAPGKNIMGCVKTMIQKLEDGEEITARSA
jgi:large subunit ribosomal protein L10